MLGPLKLKSFGALSILLTCPRMIQEYGTTGNDIVTLFVKSQFSSSERRFHKSDLIREIKRRLELITGRVLSIALESAPLEDDKMLGFYSPQDFMVFRSR